MSTNTNKLHANLIPGILAENTTYSDFCNSVEAVYEAKINGTIDQLMRVRFPNQRDDVEVSKNNVRLLGFNVTEDFQLLSGVRGNSSIYKIPYMFSQYHTTSSSEKFFLFLSFCLNREVVCTPLYTKDYSSFFAKPQGTLSIDGGEWYKTTHVDLSVDITNFDNIVIKPGSDIKSRIVNIFYEFAPIQLVIKRFWFVKKLKFEPSLSVAMTTKLGRRSVSVGGQGLSGGQPITQLQSIEISGDSHVYSNTMTYYTTILKWSNNYYEKVTTKIDSNKPLISIDDTGIASIGTTNTDQHVILSVSYGGFADTKNVTVHSVYVLQGVEIIGEQSLVENSYSNYHINLLWANGNITALYSSQDLVWSIITNSNGIASFADSHVGSLTVGSIGGEVTNVQQVTVVIKVQYTFEGTVHSETKEIAIFNISNDISLESIEIQGLPMILENSSQKYRCLAHFSGVNTNDPNQLPIHKQKYITPKWHVQSTAAIVHNDGTLVSGSVSKDLQLRLTATYTYCGLQKFAQCIVLLQHSRYSIESGVIIGPDIVSQRQIYNYNLVLRYVDTFGNIVGSSAVKADSWHSDTFFIDDNGTLKIGSLDSNVNVTISARVTMDNVTFEYYKVLIAYAHLIQCKFITIRGRPSLTFGADSQTNTFVYAASANYSDGSKKAVVPIWSIIDSNGTVSIDSTGAVSFVNFNVTPTVTNFEIGASYTETNIYTGLSETFQDFFVVSIVIPIVTVTEIHFLTAPDEITETTHAEYVVEATFSDGTTDTITPIWSFACIDSVYTEEQIGEIDRKGNFVVRLLDEPTSVILKADYFGKVVTKTVNLTKYIMAATHLPNNTKIEGDNTIDGTNGYSQYTMYIQPHLSPDNSKGVTLYNDNQYYSVSANWELYFDDGGTLTPYEDEHVVVDENGTVRVLEYLEASYELALKATFSCNYAVGQYAVAYKYITVPGKTVSVGELLIEGESYIRSGTVSYYEAFLNQNNVSNSENVEWRIANVKIGNVELDATHDVRRKFKLKFGELTVWNITNINSLPYVTTELEAVYHEESHYYVANKVINIIKEFFNMEIEGELIIENNTINEYVAIVRGATDIDVTEDSSWRIVTVKIEGRNASTAIKDSISIVGGRLVLQQVPTLHSVEIVLEAYYQNLANSYYAYYTVSTVGNFNRFGVGPYNLLKPDFLLLRNQNIQEQIREYMPNLVEGSNTQASITVSVQINLYAYYIHPASFGTAIFENVDNGYIGGWDGASWGDSDATGFEIPNTLGPIPVPININGTIVEHKLYRMDFSGGDLNGNPITYSFNITYIL